MKLKGEESKKVLSTLREELVSNKICCFDHSGIGNKIDHAKFKQSGLLLVIRGGAMSSANGHFL